MTLEAGCGLLGSRAERTMPFVVVTVVRDARRFLSVGDSLPHPTCVPLSPG